MSSDIVNIDNGYFTLTDRVTKSNATSAVTYPGNFSVSGALGITGTLSGSKANWAQPNSLTYQVSTAGTFGIISTVNESTLLAASSSATFTVINSTVTSTSIVFINLQSYVTGVYGTNGFPVINVQSVSNGSFQVTVSNVHATNALSGQLVFSYLIIN